MTQKRRLSDPTDDTCMCISVKLNIRKKYQHMVLLTPQMVDMTPRLKELTGTLPPKGLMRGFLECLAPQT